MGHDLAVGPAAVLVDDGQLVGGGAEVQQAGIFEVRNLPGDQMQAILGIACPGMVYPYLRAIVSDVCTRAGFPPVLLSEVNFQAMYEAQMQQAAAANGQPQA